MHLVLSVVTVTSFFIFVTKEILIEIFNFFSK